ncbi:proton extrusion protein PcxA [Calothrix sp. PCC 6303]|uniref:proton extrusion protein PcxA n=1 Tax=Calothrix sp. PCC 6303 TaxID=1170562 RepID=UPI0002A01688|nr:proton extrusion protein PcxA [Calothrix sp. PCC 6303]AFZ02104.1 envelope membrane protein [Calothrix sp. PCC 6303]
MNNLSLSQKLYFYLVSLYKWYLRTPQRSLDEAYQAALQIKGIEDEHFHGNQINLDFTINSSVSGYFAADLRKNLKIVRMRLTEFNSSRFFLNESNQQTMEKYAVNLPNAQEVLEKLQFIDVITSKYTNLDNFHSSVQVNPPVNSQLSTTPNKLNITKTSALNPEAKNSNILPGNKASKTGILPRSILTTISRLQIELDPKSEEDVVQKFRMTQRRTIISIRFVLLLIIVPILTHQLSKAIFVGPLVDHFHQSATAEIFINQEMEEEALQDLQRFEERLRFQNLLGITAPLSAEEIETSISEKANEIAKEYRIEGAGAIKNVFSDICSVLAVVIFLVLSKREIAIFKDFIDSIVYGLSDSAKAFIIILFTDIFVGFHSPHGWEVLLEGVSRHWGLPASHNVIFLFIATFPVILDTIFKYWIFRYLNRISPSAVATYHNMNE